VKDHSLCRQQAEKKVSFMLGLSDKKSVTEQFLRDHHKYGLGNFRSLDDFWKASGISLKDKTVEKWSKGNKVSDDFKGYNFHISKYEKIK
jgi:hypothetical protein